MSDVSVHFSFGIAAQSCCSTTTGSSPLRDADPVRDAQHVAIDRQPGHAERVAEDDVGGLAADAGQLRELLHRRRDLAAVLLARPRPPCRRATSTWRGRNRWTGSAARARRSWPCAAPSAFGIALEQRRRDLVDPLVGALRRQDRRDEQLVRRREIQLGVGAGMLAFELLQDRPRVGRGFHGSILATDRRGQTFGRGSRGQRGHVKPQIRRFRTRRARRSRRGGRRRHADGADEAFAGPQPRQQLHRAGEERLVERRGFGERSRSRVDAAVGEADRAASPSARRRRASGARGRGARTRGGSRAWIARVRAGAASAFSSMRAGGSAVRRMRLASIPAAWRRSAAPARPTSDASCGSESFAIWPRRRMPAARSLRASAGSIPGSISILRGERKRAS